MRNYWMRIALGALAIFTVGMVGHSLIHRGLNRVKGVVEGSGPLSIPLAFIPFQLGGDKLGTLERVTLERTTPRSVSSVRLEVKLSDSLLARGLEGCRLAVNLDDDHNGRQNIKIQPGRIAEGTFRCVEDAAADSAPAGSDLVEYGQAVFRPGDVSVPLYLEQDLVDELQDLDFGEDSAPPSMQAEAESVVAAEATAAAATERQARRSTPVVRAKMVDSLRAEGLRRADSARRVITTMADSTAAR